MTPTEFIHCLLKAQVDLIWNGGIGTYVKGTKESHIDVGDKAGDALRVNGAELRCKVFGEGGNLGLTQLGRIEYCLNGGSCNTDFIDNAAGVDCSDHEVNIKILLNEVVRSGDITCKQRNKLLEEMTDTVSELVLMNNYRQTQAISVAEYQGSERIGEYRRFINNLVNRGRLDRRLEYIPSDDALLEREIQGKSLTRPELSVLISYAKVMLKEELAGCDISMDKYIALSIERAFPQVLRDNFDSPMYKHILRKEIVATQLGNDIVNNMGINFCLRLMESTGSDCGQVARAYVASRDILSLEHYWKEIESLDYKVPADLQVELMTQKVRRVRRATRWILRNRRNQYDLEIEIGSFKPLVDSLLNALPNLLRGEASCEWEQEFGRLVELGVPEKLAKKAAIPANLYSVLAMVEAAKESGADIVHIADVHLALSEKLGLH